MNTAQQQTGQGITDTIDRLKTNMPPYQTIDQKLFEAHEELSLLADLFATTYQNKDTDFVLSLSSRARMFIVLSRTSDLLYEAANHMEIEEDKNCKFIDDMPITEDRFFAEILKRYPDTEIELKKVGINRIGKHMYEVYTQAAVEALRKTIKEIDESKSQTAEGV
ncbi:MAG: hypothetical protein H7843_01870 [Nitrospirota bacterium]